MAATKQEMTLIVRAKNAASGPLKAVSRDLDKVYGKTSMVEKGFAGFRKIGTAAVLGVGAAVAAFAVKGVADFLSFDDKMTQSLAIMGDEAQNWRGKMEEAAREVGKTTTFSASQAAESYYFLASAGYDAQQAIAAMPQVAKFAQAGMFDMARATDLATDAQSALGMTSKDAQTNLTNLTRVTDVLVKANTLANASVEQFSTSLTNKAGAALKVVGKDIEEGVAVLAAFADQGIKGAEAGTAMNIVMREMQTKAIKNKDVFEDFGVAVFDASGEMNNMGDIVMQMETALEGMSDEQKKVTLAQMGFSDKSVIFMQTLLGQGQAIKDYEAKLREAGGTTEEVASKQLESASAQFKLLFAQIQDVGIELGSVLVPQLLGMAKNVLPVIVEGIKAFVEGVKKIFEWFTNLSPAVQKAILIIGGLTVALAMLYAHPVVAGIGLVTALIIKLGSASAKAKGDAKSLAADLEEMGTFSFENLEQAFGEDMITKMIDSGATIQDVTDAITGFADASFEGSSELWDMMEAAGWTKDELEDMRDVVWRTGTELDKMREKEELTAEASRDAALAASQHAADVNGLLGALYPATTALGEGTDALIDIEGSTLDAEAAIDGFISTLQHVADPVFGAVDAARDLQQMLVDIDEDGERTNEELWDLAQATLDVGAQFDALDPGAIEGALGAVSTALGISKSEAHDLLVEMGLLDGLKVQTEIEHNIDIHINTYGNTTVPELPASGPGSIGDLLRAKGGPVAMDQPYIVGEDGPEWFVPNSSGYIMPNGTGPSAPAGGGGDGFGSEVHLHLHDVDLSDGGRRTIERIREGIRQMDMETL